MYEIEVFKKENDKLIDRVFAYSYSTMKDIEKLLNTDTTYTALKIVTKDNSPLPSNSLDNDVKEYFPSFIGSYVTIRIGDHDSDSIEIKEIITDNRLFVRADSKLLEFYIKSNEFDKYDKSYQLVYKNGIMPSNTEKPNITETAVPGFGTIYSNSIDGPALMGSGLVRAKPELDYLAKYNKNFIMRNSDGGVYDDTYVLSNNLECIIAELNSNYGMRSVYLVIDNHVVEPVNLIFIRCSDPPTIGFCD